MNNKDLITYYVEFVFPTLSVLNKWPIRFDHCFRRVIYDNAFGGVWNKFVEAPAIHNMSAQQLQSCVDICQLIVKIPSLMVEYNNKSLAWRNHD